MLGPLMGWPMQSPCKVKVLVLVLVPCRCKLFLSHEPWTPTVLGSDFSTPNTKGLCHLPHAGPSASFVVRRLLTPAHFSLLSLTFPTPSIHPSSRPRLTIWQTAAATLPAHGHGLAPAITHQAAGRETRQPQRI